MVLPKYRRSQDVIQGYIAVRLQALHSEMAGVFKQNRCSLCIGIAAVRPCRQRLVGNRLSRHGVRTRVSEACGKWRGFAGLNLIRFRQFYLAFPYTLIRSMASNIFQTPSGISDRDIAGKAIVQTVSALFAVCNLPDTSGIFQTASEKSGMSLPRFRSAQFCDIACHPHYEPRHHAWHVDGCVDGG